MSKLSLIYRNIRGYRFVMNLLYKGEYRKRFQEVTKELTNFNSNQRVLELCFGDTYIAKFCRDKGLKWNGIDLNEHFVSEANRLGFEAQCEDIADLKTLPEADVCIMIGALYHFYPDVPKMLDKMFASAGKIIISESIMNLSNSGGVIGLLARRAANAGKGHEEFRYNKDSLLKQMETYKTPPGFSIVTKRQVGRDFIITFSKDGNSSY